MLHFIYRSGHQFICLFWLNEAPFKNQYRVEICNIISWVKGIRKFACYMFPVYLLQYWRIKFAFIWLHVWPTISYPIWCSSGCGWVFKGRHDVSPSTSWHPQSLADICTTLKQTVGAKVSIVGARYASHMKYLFQTVLNCTYSRKYSCGYCDCGIVAIVECIADISAWNICVYNRKWTLLQPNGALMRQHCG